MGVATALARTGVRRRKAALAGLALVVTTGLGVSLAAMEAAVRTERAYPEYLRQANVAELVVNPSLATTRVGEILAATPGIASFTSDDLLNATVDEGAPRTQRKVDSSTIQLRMSANGRYTAQDRPVVREGRMVRGGAAEAFLSEDTAAALGVGVGDQIPLAFWRPSFNTPGAGPGQEDTVAPVGRATARVVGVGLFADEVLAEDLYPRRRLVVSADVAARFTCDLTPPGAGDQRDAVELLPTVMPERCALAYRYFSLQLAGGDAGVDQVVDRLRTAFDAENQRLPPALRELDVGYTVIPSATRDQRQRLDRSLRPIIHGLELFAVAAGLSTVVVAGMSALRLARRDETARTIWLQLGVDRRQRFAALAMPLAGAVTAGVVGAVAVGFALSGLGPVASARAIVPRPALGLTGRAALLVALPASLLLVAAVAGAALVVARRRLEPSAGRGSLISRFSSLVHPARGLGMRAAARGPGSMAVLAGAVVAVAVVLASLVFSGSVNRLVTQPARYGWPYDAGVMVGYGYGGADADAVARTLENPDVTAWGLADLATLTVKGQSVPAIAARRNFSSLPIAVVGGRLPEADDEVALGVKSAAALDVGVGDKVALAGSFGRRSAVVTGTVILPPLGPFESDRAATGTGALLSERFYDAWVAGYEKASGIPAGGLASQSDGSFIGIELEDGVDPTAFLAGLTRQLTSWDRNGFDSFTYPAPVRPSVITDVASMRRVPMALGGFLALSMATGLAVAIAVATRGRRRELALLGALGCQPRQRAASVRWHALTIAGIAVVVGTPLGIALGRTEYRAFAGDLGVAGDALVSLAWTAGVAALTAGVGFLAAAGPARATAKLRPAEVLRDQ